jgi:DNA-binding transcriptional ArsR family regulator
MPRPVSHDPLSRMLRAIADPTRRLSQPTVSHHMAILKEAGLVHAEKYEQWMWYRRNPRGLEKLRRALNIEL